MEFPTAAWRAHAPGCEVLVTVGDGGEVVRLLHRVEGGAARAHPLPGHARHVVDHSVHKYPE